MRAETLMILPAAMPPEQILQMVLLGTGEPIDLLHVEEDEKGRRYFVERPCGDRLLIEEDQLGCRGFRLH